MRIFDRVNTNSDHIEAPVFEGYNDTVNGDIIALQESWDDQLAIMEAFYNIEAAALTHESEVSRLQESGADAYELEQVQEQHQIVTEALVKNAAGKVKEFFKKLWGKIKAFFATVVRTFDAQFKSGAEFAKKYEGQIAKLNLNGFKFKMYNYTLDALNFYPAGKDEYKLLVQDAVTAATGADKDIKKLEEEIRNIRENKEDNLNKERGEYLKTGSLTADEYHKELFKKLRGGADGGDKNEISVDIKKVIADLKDTKGKKQVLEIEKQTNDLFSNAIKGVESVESKISSAQSKDGKVTIKHDGSEHSVKSDGSSVALEALRAYAGMFSSQRDIAMAAFRAWKDAYAERARTYKGVVTAAFRYKEEK